MRRRLVAPLAALFLLSGAAALAQGADNGRIVRFVGQPQFKSADGKPANIATLPATPIEIEGEVDDDFKISINGKPYLVPAFSVLTEGREGDCVRVAANSSRPSGRVAAGVRAGSGKGCEGGR